MKTKNNQKNNLFLITTVLAIVAILVMFAGPNILDQEIDSIVGEAFSTRSSSATKGGSILDSIQKQETFEFCTDSDLGNDPELYGVVEITSKSGTTSSSWGDSCHTDGTVQYEAVCSFDENGEEVADFIGTSCDCQSGECIAQMQHAEDNQFGISEEIIEQLKDDLRISHESPRSAEKLKTFDGPIVEVDSLVREEGDDSTFIERDSCEDSDGLDYAVSGEVDFLDEQSHVVTWEDTCIEQTNVLYEWYCSEDLIPKYEAVNCVRGCDEGICIGGMVSTEASADDLVDTSPDASDIELLDTCIETDGGNDPYTRGDLTIAAGAPISDWCNSAGRLIEYYCESGSAIEQSYEVYDCATSCVDGACETPPIEVE